MRWCWLALLASLAVGLIPPCASWDHPTPDAALASGSNSLPLSYILADTKFLEDEVSVVGDQAVDAVDAESRVARYISLLQRSLGLGLGVSQATEDEGQQRARRHLPVDSLTTLTKDPQGVFLLKELKKRFNIPAKFPNDMMLFSRNESGVPAWYAVALEADDVQPEKSLANALVLYKLTGDRFLERHRVNTFGASSLAVHEIEGSVYVAVAERMAQHRDAPNAGSILYRLSNHEESLLEYVETLNTVNPTDLCFWEYLGSHYLAVTSEFRDSSGNASYKSETLVFDWRGQHLDLIQPGLPSYGARAVTAFAIDSIQYLAVANHIDDQGDTNIKSMVYRYDLVKKRFVDHQPLNTHAAVDISYFSMDRPKGKDHFLAVANLYYQGPDKQKNFETMSVIYKWTERNFVAFQSVTLVGASQWTSYTGPRGESLLLAASMFGLHAFQYDGWRFQQMSLVGDRNLVGHGARISSLRTQVFNSQGLIVIANKRPVDVNVYSLTFERSTPLAKLYSEINYWCRGQLADLEASPVENLAERVRNAPKWDSSVVEVTSVTFESKSTINSLAANSFKSNTSGILNSAVVSELNALAKDLKRMNNDLVEANAIIKAAMKKDEVNVVDHVNVDEVFVQCPAKGCHIASTQVRLLNGKDVEAFMQNTIQLNEDINATALRFADIVVPGNLVTRRVLGREEPLVSRVATEHLLGTLEVAELHLHDGIKVDGTIDGTRINRASVLLVDGNQQLSDHWRFSRWEVNKLVLRGYVNGFNLDVSKPELPREMSKPGPPSSLVVRNVKLGGLLGGVDVRHLRDRALRTHGNQVVSGAHSFSRLVVESATVNSLNVEDVLRIDKPKEAFDGELVFSQPLTAGKVTVYERLNHVNVANDLSMDLLLRSGQAGVQNVTGNKIVHQLRVTEEGRIHGRVLGLVVPTDEELVRVVEEDITVDGIVTITGRVNVDGSVVASDIVEASSGLSVLNVIQRAIPLDRPLPPSVIIDELEISNLNVSLVNGIRTESWIVNSPAAKVIISQPVTFDGGLTVTKSSTLHGSVNNINLRLLSQTALTTTGDQIIHGLKSFNSITSNNVSSGDSWLGGQRWKDVWESRTTQPQHQREVKINTGLVVAGGTLSTSRLRFVCCSLGGVDVFAALTDSVFKDDADVIIEGPTTFLQTFTANNLQVGDNVGGDHLNRILATLAKSRDEINFELPSITIQNPISVAHLRYHGTLDGVRDSVWDEPWMMVDGDQTLVGDQTVLGNVDALSGVRVAMGVNNVDLTKFARQAAMVNDANLHLGSVAFSRVDSEGPVTAGSLSGVNLDNVLLARGAMHQVVTGRFTLDGLEIMGKLMVEGSLAGENFTDLCRFAQPSSVSRPQMLTVKGDVDMDEEPVVKNVINGNEMSKLFKNTWFRDRSARITTEMEFGDVEFNQNVKVEDRIDGVNLEAISERYFSLTRDSLITTKLVVQKGVEVQGQLISREPIKVDGLVGSQRLTELQSSVLMDGVDQDILAHMKFDAVRTTSDLTLNGTINGLNLATDVVLLKADSRLALDHNVVTERKKFRGLKVTDLGLLASGARIQDVDVMRWIQDAVRVDGSYTVTGTKTLRNPNVVGDMKVHGLVNGVRVDAQSLLLRHSDQVVTGPKVIRPATLVGQGLRVVDLEAPYINNVDVKKLLTNQAYRTSDVVVATPVQFAASLHARSVTLEGPFQGINISEVIEEAKNPLLLNQYAQEHEALRMRVDRVRRSLTSQGYYLNYYHTSVELRSGVRAVLPLGKVAGSSSDIGDPAAAIAVVKEVAIGDGVVVNFFTFDFKTGTILPHDTLRQVTLGRNVHLIEPGTFTALNALYWELYDTSSAMYLGYVMGLTREGQLGVAEMFRDSIPSAWVSLSSWNDKSSCLIRGSPGNFNGRGEFCTVHCIPGPTTQAVPVHRPLHATTLLVNGSPLLFIASGAGEASEGEVTVWRLSSTSAALTVLLQRFEIVNASALAAIEYRGVPYLAVASGQVEGAAHLGMVHIIRYNAQHGNWSHWMTEDVEGPRSLQFSQLPSGELALYVSTTCPTNSLVVLLYRGLSGFVRKASAAVPLGGPTRAFNTAMHQHVVAVAAAPPAGRAVLLQANFKGSWEVSARQAWARSP